MARPPHPRRPKRPKHTSGTLRELGFRVTVVGLAFLIVPSLFGASVMMNMVAKALSFPGWMLLAAGVAILGIVYARKSSNPASSAAGQGVTPANSPARTDRDKPEPGEGIFRHAPSKAPHLTHTQLRREPVMSPDIDFGRKTDTSSEPVSTQPSEWNPAVFAAIEWRRFEAVCEALFGQAGFETRSQTHGADGGVDIWLHSRHAVGPVAVVQCKHWQGKAVGVREMREFYGVMASHKLQRGTYATSSTYTEDARQFAKANGINAMDGARLLQQIATRTPAQQQALLAVAYEGEYWRPTCASCGIKLVERQAAKTRSAFWGCVHYPRCRTSFPMAASAK